VCRDVSPQRQLEDQLRRAVLYDDSTGLPNRALLVEQLGRALATAERRPVALLLVDFDRFGRVNEGLGFSTGDAVLKAQAERMMRSARPRDLVARHGGDLFAHVVVDIADELDAIAAADRLGRELSSPVQAGSHAVALTVSIGIAVAPPGVTDPLDLIRTAEVALHRAKDDGGNCFRVFDEGLDRRARERMELETDLRAALDSTQWDLHYQPIIDARSRAIVSCEALLRWTHPARGAVPPPQVIAVAEATGLIGPLGSRILARAAQDAAAFEAQGVGVPVGVNVSPSQLAAPGFCDDLRATLAAAQVDADRIVLEVTETVLAAETEAMEANLHAVRALGCKVAMDDFGTGYSSLATLRDLPIDVLKLDRTFITQLLTSPRSAAAVRSVIQLAGSLDLLVVAEGVEDPEQLDELVMLGCDRVQGWVVAPALPRDEFLGFVRA
jgi:diguanylate cyclase (GGDEF)-like protein